MKPKTLPAKTGRGADVKGAVRGTVGSSAGRSTSTGQTRRKGSARPGLREAPAATGRRLGQRPYFGRFSGQMNWEALSTMPEALGCELLEPIPASPPFHRGHLRELGVRGLQVGCLNRMHRSCLNLDLCRLSDRQGYSTEPGRIFRVSRRVYFMEQDATKKLPFEGGCFDWVYAEHFIEHITQPQAIAWLKEVKRILKPGGLLRLTTPDLRLYVEGYLDPDDAFFTTHRAQMLALGCPPLETRKAWMINQIFRFWGHKWTYDLDELRYVIRRAGFSRDFVTQCGFRQGSDPEVASLDFGLRRDETIYVEVRNR